MGVVALSAYVSIRQHTSAYVSIRQHTSAYVSQKDLFEKNLPIPRRRNSHADIPVVHVVVPAAQDRQTVAPDCGEYFPVPHNVEVVPPAAHDPQTVTSNENFPTSHAVHVASQVSLPLKQVVFPATHDRQVVALVMMKSEYFPTTHGV